MDEIVRSANAIDVFAIDGCAINAKGDRSF